MKKTIFILYIFLVAFSIGYTADRTFTPVVGTNFSNVLNWDLVLLPATDDNLRINGICSYDNLANNLAYGSLNIGFSESGTLSWPVGGMNTLRVTDLSSSTAGSTLDMTNGGTLQIGGTWTSTNMSFTPGSGTIIITSTVTLPAAFSTYNNLTINVAGGTVSLGTNTTINGTLTLTNGSLSIGTNTLTINGLIVTTDGSLTGGNTSNITFGGTGVSTTLPSVTLNNLTLNRASGISIGSGGVTLNGTLTLTSGKITLGNNNLTIGSAGTISGASTSNYIITDGTGTLTRNGVGSTTVEFPVGPVISYNPVTIQNSGTLDNFSIRVQTTFDNPPIDPTKVVNMQWTVTEAVPGGSLALLSFQFNSGEGASQFSTSDPVFVGRWNGSAWVGYLASLTGSGPFVVSTNEYVTSFSPFGIGNEGSLPVQLSYFNALVSMNNVNLSWGTVQEINNRGFEVQRKNNSVSNGIWEKIGFVNGYGTTNEPKNYTYKDAKLNVGKYQYRLKQIDFNGNSEYFNLPNDVVLGKPGEFTVSQNYPNPSNPKTKIDYHLPFDSKVTLQVFDIAGKQVGVLVNENKTAGYYTAEFDGTNLSSGIYFYRLTAGSFVKTMKMSLIK